MTLHLVVDCETTGLFDYTKPADAEGQPRLCQLGMIWLNEDFSVKAEAEYLIKPSGWTLSEEAAKVNGLTQDLLEEHGVSPRIALTDYASAIDSKHVIVGFNAPYDIKLLRAELRYLKEDDRYMKTRTLCVMQGCRDIVGARTEMGRKKAPTLAEACKYFGIEMEPVPHRALGGARACLTILRHLRDMGMMPPYKDPYDKTKYK